MPQSSPVRSKYTPPDNTQQGRMVATQLARARFSSTRHQLPSSGASTMPPPPPNTPLTAPAKAPDTPSRPRFTGITSVEYVSGGPSPTGIPSTGVS